MKEFWNKLTVFGKVKFVTSILLGILVLIFAIQNYKAVNIKLINTEISLSLMLVILISVAIGFLLASFLDYKKFNKKNKKISSLVKQVEVLTEKIKNIEQEKIAQEPKK